MAEETMAEETMAEEAPAPEAMPVTGGSDASGTLFAVATLIVAVLAGFALLFRRRMA
jgi:LPXTG-motif cell wall-anchored protein